MQLTLSDAHNTHLRGLYRIAGSDPSSPLLLGAHASGDVWQLDWQSKSCVRQYCPQSSLMQRLVGHAASPSHRESLQRPLHDVRAIVLGKNGPLVIDADARTGRTNLLELRSGRRQLIARGRPAFTAACTVPVKMIALGGHARISLWQWPGGNALGELAGHNDGARDMAFSPDGRLLVSVGGESEDEQHRDAIRLWDVQTLTELKSWMWHHFGAVAFHPGGAVIAVGCMMPAAIKLWHLNSGAIETLAVEAPGGISALCFSPDGQWLWAGDREGRVMLFAIEDG